MKKVMFLMAFFLTSVLDIRVKAEIVSFPRVKAVESPESCFLQSSVCGFKSHKNAKSEIQLGDAKIILDSDSIVFRMSAGDFTLLKGAAWIRGVSEQKFSSEYGDVTFQGAEVFLIRQRQRILVQVVEGEAILHPRGSKENLKILAGFQNWIGPVNEKKEGRTGVPEALDLRGLISRWAPIYDRSREEFRRKIQKVQVVWYEALESSRGLHQQLAERHIASFNAEKARQQRSQEAYRSETQRFRSLMINRLRR